MAKRSRSEQTFWYSLAQRPVGFASSSFLSPSRRLGRLNWAGVWMEEGKERGGGEAAGTGGDWGAGRGCKPRRNARSVLEPKPGLTGPVCVRSAARVHTHAHTKAYAGWTVPVHLSCWPSTNKPQCQNSYKLWHRLLSAYEDEETKVYTCSYWDLSAQDTRIVPFYFIH